MAFRVLTGFLGQLVVDWGTYSVLDSVLMLHFRDKMNDTLYHWRLEAFNDTMNSRVKVGHLIPRNPDLDGGQTGN